MTENEIIDFLTEQSARDMTALERHVTLVDLAHNYGLDLDRDDDLLIEQIRYSLFMGTRIYLNDDYVVTLDAHLQRIANLAIEYLNDTDVVPAAYDHGETDPRAGYGLPARDDAADVLRAAVTI